VAVFSSSNCIFLSHPLFLTITTHTSSAHPLLDRLARVNVNLRARLEMMNREERHLVAARKRARALQVRFV
jgi:hypothetical protein